MKPKTKSDVTDLVKVTEAAHHLLRTIHITQVHFARLEDPHKEGANLGVYFAPRHCLIYFFELRRAAVALRKAWTEKVRWELAGLASSRGLTAGAGTFPSAHEILAEAGRVVDTNLQFLLIDETFVAKVDATFEWDKGERSIPQDQIEAFTEHWQEDGRSGFFLDLIWDMVQAIRFVRVLELRGVLDCEHALARRGRGIRFDEPGFPKTPLAGLEQQEGSGSRFGLDAGWVSAKSLVNKDIAFINSPRNVGRFCDQHAIPTRPGKTKDGKDHRRRRDVHGPTFKSKLNKARVEERRIQNAGDKLATARFQRELRK